LRLSKRHSKYSIAKEYFTCGLFWHNKRNHFKESAMARLTVLFILLSIGLSAEEPTVNGNVPKIGQVAEVATKNMTDVIRESWDFEVSAPSNVAVIFSSNGGSFNVFVSKKSNYQDFCYELACYEQEKAEYKRLQGEVTTSQNKDRWKELLTKFGPQGIVNIPKLKVANNHFIQTNVSSFVRIKELPTGEYVVCVRKLKDKTTHSNGPDKGLVRSLVRGALVLASGHPLSAAATATLVSELFEDGNEEMRSAGGTPDTLCKVAVVVEEIKQKEATEKVSNNEKAKRLVEGGSE
jgi:hypothetical protein